MLNLKEQIIDGIERLSPDQQVRVLELVQTLRASAPLQGTAGSLLLAHLEKLQFEAGEVDRMMKAIEEDCERVDADGW
jgi:hypothetical protein